MLRNFRKKNHRKASIPNDFEHKKLGAFFSILKYPIIVVSNIGKNNNFKCSHTLSLIAENDATKIFSPKNSYVKCSKVPNIHTKIVLNI